MFILALTRAPETLIPQAPALPLGADRASL